ncbi:MAG TPA: HAD-IA family hydrolase [Gemmatimonadaceae bacterium]|nr:HAD-IA family hydrolase [Gemmatimonadaceae bacterium]
MCADRSSPLALLFDLDGTLVDSIELIRSSFRHACATVLAREIAEEDWLAGVGTPLRTQMQGFARDETETDALIAAYRSHQLAHHDRLLAEYAGVREALETLRREGHSMAIVTSKAHALAVRALERMRLSEFMDAVIGCDSCTRHKPDPEPVRIALERLGARPRDAVFIGDSPHDIAAGNAAGVTTVGVLWGPFPRSALGRAHHLIEHPSALPPLVRALARAGAA